MEARRRVPGELGPRALGTCAGACKRVRVVQQFPRGIRERVDIAGRDDSSCLEPPNRLGKSADVGQKLAGTLNSTGTRSYTLDATRAVHGDLGMVHPDDVALRDRRMLSADGIFIVVATVDSEDGSSVAPPEIIFRGVPFLEEADADGLIGELRVVVEGSLADAAREGVTEPVLLHILTQKGRGYAPALEKPDKFHGLGKFEPTTGATKSTSTPTYSEIYGKTLAKFAEQNNKIVAITGAMPTNRASTRGGPHGRSARLAPRAGPRRLRGHRAWSATVRHREVGHPSTHDSPVRLPQPQTGYRRSRF